MLLLFLYAACRFWRVGSCFLAPTSECFGSLLIRRDNARPRLPLRISVWNHRIIFDSLKPCHVISHNGGDVVECRESPSSSFKPNFNFLFSVRFSWVCLLAPQDKSLTLLSGKHSDTARGFPLLPRPMERSSLSNRGDWHQRSSSPGISVARGDAVQTPC